jgi:hypothetical protein
MDVGYTALIRLRYGLGKEGVGRNQGFYILIPIKNKIKKLPKGITRIPDLDKYANQQLFKEKVEKTK